VCKCDCESADYGTCCIPDYFGWGYYIYRKNASISCSCDQLNKCRATACKHLIYEEYVSSGTCPSSLRCSNWSGCISLSYCPL
jgi:hypothetical protein